MRSRWKQALGLAIAAVGVAGAIVSAPVAAAHARPLEVDIWTSHGEDAVVCPGQPVDIYFQTTKRARVVVYAIDTDGWVRLLHPAYVGQDPTVRGRRTYRVRGRGVDALSEAPGGFVLVGVVAARERFPVAHWFECRDVVVFCEDGSWNTTRTVRDPHVIGRVAGDPFDAVWAIEETLVPSSISERGVAADLCWYSIGSRVHSPWYVYVERNRFDCGPEFCLSLGLGFVFDWPRCVIRTCSKPCYEGRRSTLPVCEVREPKERWKWKAASGEISKESRNKKAVSNVLQSETSKALREKSGAGKKDQAKPNRSEKRLTDRKPEAKSLAADGARSERTSRVAAAGGGSAKRKQHK